MNDGHPEKDFPWSFYFNGEVMPKWGACWSMAGVLNYLHLEHDGGQDDGRPNIHRIYCQIDHVGVIESADPEIFIFAVQEVLHILLSQRDAVHAALIEHPQDVYPGLVEAAFRMRELAVEQRRAFWTSGYEADGMQLIEVMRRCQLSADSPEFTLPPHIQHMRRALKYEREAQVRRLHQLAQSGQFDKDTRKKLHEISAA